MTDQELIKQLRDRTFLTGSLEGLAANRIEELVKERDYTDGTNDTLIALNQALEAKLAKAEEERDELGRKLNTARYGQPDFAWSIHEEAMADLRAKLTKAVEALRWYDDRFTARKARDVLADLEGK